MYNELLLLRLFSPSNVYATFLMMIVIFKVYKNVFIKIIENFIWTEHSFKMTTVIKNKFFQMVQKLRTRPDNDLWCYLRPCILQTRLQHIDRWMRYCTSSWLQDAPDCNPTDYAIWSILESWACAKPHSSEDKSEESMVWDNARGHCQVVCAISGPYGKNL